MIYKNCDKIVNNKLRWCCCFKKVILETWVTERRHVCRRFRIYLLIIKLVGKSIPTNFYIATCARTKNRNTVYVFTVVFPLFQCRIIQMVIILVMRCSWICGDEAEILLPPAVTILSYHKLIYVSYIYIYILVKTVQKNNIIFSLPPEILFWCFLFIVLFLISASRIYPSGPASLIISKRKKK